MQPVERLSFSDIRALIDLFSRIMAFYSIRQTYVGNILHILLLRIITK